MVYEITGYDSAPGYFRIRQRLGGFYDLGEIYVSNSAALQRDSIRNYVVGIVRLLYELGYCQDITM